MKAHVLAVFLVVPAALLVMAEAKMQTTLADQLTAQAMSLEASILLNECPQIREPKPCSDLVLQYDPTWSKDILMHEMNILCRSHYEVGDEFYEERRRERYLKHGEDPSQHWYCTPRRGALDDGYIEHYFPEIQARSEASETPRSPVVASDTTSVVASPSTPENQATEAVAGTEGDMVASRRLMTSRPGICTIGNQKCRIPTLDELLGKAEKRTVDVGFGKSMIGKSPINPSTKSTEAPWLSVK